jgi:two-component system CAI-1 autoinducer sensor kinase/phosphatase CqsS
MSEAMARIQFEVRHMNHMIDLFLLSATAVNQQLEATEYLSMAEVVDSVIGRYPFTGNAQRNAVTVDVRADFTFAGRCELSVVVVLNLLRNALKALHRAGKGRVRIVVDGARTTPRLLFIDTGCGIAPSQLPMIFERFYSYPPSAGSGIGLALCKEIINAWQASIRVLSREHAYTVFVLEFPKVQLAAPAPALAA